MTSPAGGVPTREGVAAVLWESGLVFSDDCDALADVVTTLYAAVVEQGARDRAAVERVEALADELHRRRFDARRAEFTGPDTWYAATFNAEYRLRAALDVTEPPSEGEA